MFIENGFKDVLVGSELFRALNVGQGELKSPVQTQKIQEIAEYLNSHPDPMFVIGRVKNNKGTMSNLDFLTSYVKLSKEKTMAQEKMVQLDKDLKFYE